jgi:acyl-CoA thioester hydrolase
MTGGGDAAVEVRVRYPEVDRMGVAHHTVHFVWFEIGRTELMRRRGAVYAALEDQGLFLPVVGAECTYRAPARYDDIVRVRTEVTSIRGARIDFSYRIERAADGVLLATGVTRHAAIDGRGRPRRLPKQILECMA